MTPKAYPEIFSMKIFTKGNKNGALLVEETLKIIIAVISLGFLVYFLTAIYFANVNSDDLRKADASLDRINEIISSLEISEEVDILPVGWSLFSFVEGNKPNSCAGENCLCMCDEVLVDNVFMFKDRQISECGKKGACLVAPNLESFETIEIEKDLTKILIKKEGDSVFISKI